MQSRLVAIRSFWASPLQRKRLNPWPRYTCSTISRAGDPAIHSEDPQAAKAATEKQRSPTKETHCPCPTNTKTQFASSPKLENSSINPALQQKRHGHSAPARAVEEASCVGWDGGPSGDEVWEKEDNYKTYYKDHRPSPIPEIEIADTRTPIRRATDSGGGGGEYGSGRGEVVVWLPEQIDTAEEALLRAEAIFRAMKERGDPDSPQAKVLARLRGEAL